MWRKAQRWQTLKLPWFHINDEPNMTLTSVCEFAHFPTLNSSHLWRNKVTKNHLKHCHTSMQSGIWKYIFNHIFILVSLHYRRQLHDDTKEVGEITCVCINNLQTFMSHSVYRFKRFEYRFMKFEYRRTIHLISVMAFLLAPTHKKYDRCPALRSTRHPPNVVWVEALNSLGVYRNPLVAHLASNIAPLVTPRWHIHRTPIRTITFQKLTTPFSWLQETQ